ncbi:hypothetical protein C9374_010353 [Naegleria lovaniensis]|uniref:Uncharacterized protein n=1 Tax=Naegleria lovaniensis TaxID=51637 RepID=A0AA88GGQ1_NAELO|nr:uncharacterized protein C9374_010353 [Naegleria lovaniensis]KAG2374979.1 hypothetical protein C9374_010353 [Naegleria lovaniensis]
MSQSIPQQVLLQEPPTNPNVEEFGIVCYILKNISNNNTSSTTTTTTTLDHHDSVFSSSSALVRTPIFIPCHLWLHRIGPYLDPYDFLFGLFTVFERSIYSKTDFEHQGMNDERTYTNSLSSLLLPIGKKRGMVEIEQQYSLFFSHIALTVLKRIMLGKDNNIMNNNNNNNAIVMNGIPRSFVRAQATRWKVPSLNEFIQIIYEPPSSGHELNFSSHTYRSWVKYAKKIIFHWRSMTFSIDHLNQHMSIPLEQQASELTIHDIRWNVCLSLHENINWSSSSTRNSQDLKDTLDMVMLPARLCDAATMRRSNAGFSLIQLRFSKKFLAYKLESLINYGVSNTSDSKYLRVTPENVTSIAKSFFKNKIEKLKEICSGSMKRSTTNEVAFDNPFIMPEWIQVTGSLSIPTQTQSLFKLYVIEVHDFELLETTREKQHSYNADQTDTILTNILYHQHELLKQSHFDIENANSKFMTGLINCKSATLLHMDVRDNKRLAFKVEPHVKLEQQVKTTLMERVKKFFEEFDSSYVLEHEHERTNIMTLYHIHPKLYPMYGLKWPSSIGTIRPLKYLLKPGDSIRFKGRLLDSKTVLAYEVRLNKPSLYICTPYELLNDFLFKGSFLGLSFYLTYKKLYLDYLEALKEAGSDSRDMSLSQYLMYSMAKETLKLNIGLLIYYIMVSWPSKFIQMFASLFGFKKLPVGNDFVNRVLENINAVILFAFLVESRRTDSQFHKLSASFITDYMIWIAKWYLLFFGYKMGYSAMPTFIKAGSRVFGYLRQKFYQVRWFFFDKFFNK